MDLKNIYSLFDTAVAHKLKYPMIRLQLNGEPVILKRAGQKSRYTGQIQITNGARYGADNAKYYGRIDLDGVFQSSTPSTTDVSLFKLLLELAENPAQVAAQYGKLTGNCCFCGLTLTDPQSTAVGYGPICAGNYGLPHGQNRATKAEPAIMPSKTVAHITFKNDTFALEARDIRLIIDALNILQPDSDSAINRAQNLASAFEAIDDIVSA